MPIRSWFDPSPRPDRDPRLLRGIGLAVLLLGCRAAWLFHAAGLTLSHYDAKAHLVVARRVVDNLTPGWRQLGAVWLPLPHLLNLAPVQVDAFYRTGASAVAISILAFALAAVGVARIALRATGSAAAALAAAAVLALNPDLLYLQSTPMTEALLVALMVWAVSLTMDWVAGERAEGPAVRRSEGPEVRKSEGRLRMRAGLVIAAATLTRYEAWPVTAALLAACVVAIARRGATLREACSRVARLAAYPVLAAVAFMVQSRLTVGSWFVTGGFFVPDNIDTGNPLRAIGSIWWGLHVITGQGVELVAAAGAVAGAIAAFRDRRRAWLLAPLALVAAGALPAYAFFDGHPFRIRYMTPLVAAAAACAGIGVGLLGGRRLRGAAAVAVVALVLVETRPLDFNAPMLLEAQWDSGNAAARRQVTRYLARHYDGRTIMASMGSLAHYIQELSGAGFDVKDFLHEGNGDMWQAALKDPRPLAGWVLIEEWAEGGDRLAASARDNPRFLAGFERVAEGGGVALYRASEKSTADGQQPTAGTRSKL